MEYDWSAEKNKQEGSKRKGDRTSIVRVNNTSSYCNLCILLFNIIYKENKSF